MLIPCACSLVRNPRMPRNVLNLHQAVSLNIKVAYASVDKMQTELSWRRRSFKTRSLQPTGPGILGSKTTVSEEPPSLQSRHQR